MNARLKKWVVSFTALGIAALCLSRADAAALTKVTADAQVFGDGERIVSITAQYDTPLDPASVTVDDYRVPGRTIESVAVTRDRTAVTLTLVPLPVQEASAIPHDEGDRAKKEALGHKGPQLGSSGNPKPLPKLTASVEQTGTIRASDGTIIPPQGEKGASTVKDSVVDAFLPLLFTDPADKQTLAYNLFVPKDYDATKSYPLVLFMHDAGTVSPEQKAALVQGRGAIVFAEESFQKQHPAFVLAPQYDTIIVDDNYDYGPELDRTMHLIESLEKAYAIDKDRIYNTGQSMGGMTAIAMDVKYPDVFAGSYLVACKWDESVTAPLAKQNVWAVSSACDPGASPSLKKMFDQFEEAGSAVARLTLDPDAPQSEQNRLAAALIRPDCHLYLTSYLGGTHRSTWQRAYDMMPAIEWLFAQKRPQ